MRDAVVYATIGALVALGAFLELRDPRHVLTAAEVQRVRSGAEQYGKSFDMDVIAVPGVDTNYDGYANAVMRDRGTGMEVDLVCNYLSEPGCRRAAARIN